MFTCMMVAQKQMPSFSPIHTLNSFRMWITHKQWSIGSLVWCLLLFGLRFFWHIVVEQHVHMSYQFPLRTRNWNYSVDNKLCKNISRSSKHVSVSRFFQFAQGWQNHDVCEVVGARQGHTCHPRRSFNFNNNFFKGLVLTFMNCQSP